MSGGLIGFAMMVGGGVGLVVCALTIKSARLAWTGVFTCWAVSILGAIIGAVSTA